MPPFAPTQAPQGFPGPTSAPSGNPGLEADALTRVRGAAQILEQALPNLPFGSDAHKAVLSAIQGLSKVAPASQMPHGVNMSMLQNIGADVQKNAMLQQLMARQAQMQKSGMGQPQMQGQGGAPPQMQGQ